MAGTALAGNAVAIGAIAGGITGFVGGAILTGTLKGAFYGGLTGAALRGIGASGLNDISKSVASGAAGGITNELQGGKFGHGFLSAGLGFWSGLKFGGAPSFNRFLGTAIAGGTISSVTGGKFGNGAITAGLAYVVAVRIRSTSESAFIGVDESEVVIEADSIVPGQKLPDAIKEKIASVMPTLADALDQTTLDYASDQSLSALAESLGVHPSLVQAFARGTTIYIPRGRATSLRELTHEVAHVHQFLTVEDYAKKYNQEKQMNLNLGVSPLEAYRLNRYEMEADRFARSVVRAYEN